MDMMINGQLKVLDSALDMIFNPYPLHRCSEDFRVEGDKEICNVCGREWPREEEVTK